MPRRHRGAGRAPRPVDARVLGGVAPAWAQRAGLSVRRVSNEKAYRCPGCRQLIPPGKAHLVVVPDEDPDGRRHWHTPCWRQEQRRRG